MPHQGHLPLQNLRSYRLTFCNSLDDFNEIHNMSEIEGGHQNPDETWELMELSFDAKFGTRSIIFQRSIIALDLAYKVQRVCEFG